MHGDLHKSRDINCILWHTYNIEDDNIHMSSLTTGYRNGKGCKLQGYTLYGKMPPFNHLSQIQRTGAPLNGLAIRVDSH